jgi:hypothetical protein
METNLPSYGDSNYPRISNTNIYCKKAIKFIEGDQSQCDEFDEEVFQNVYHISTIQTKEESIKVEESVYDDAQSYVILKTEDNSNLFKLDSITNTELVKEEEKNLVIEGQFKIITNESSLIRFPEKCNKHFYFIRLH